MTNPGAQQGLRLGPEVVCREEGSGFLLYHAAQDTLYEGNRAAADVLRMLAAGLEPAELSGVLARVYGVPMAQVESDVAELLELLSAEGLVIRR